MASITSAMSEAFLPFELLRCWCWRIASDLMAPVPPGQAAPREIAVDAPHIGLAELDDLVEDRLDVASRWCCRRRSGRRGSSFPGFPALALLAGAPPRGQPALQVEHGRRRFLQHCRRPRHALPAVSLAGTAFYVRFRLRTMMFLRSIASAVG